jgi:hypothetical protein
MGSFSKKPNQKELMQVSSVGCPRLEYSQGAEHSHQSYAGRHLRHQQRRAC